MTNASPSAGRNGSSVVKAAIFVIVTCALLYYVKWNPYYHKAWTALLKHTLGASIVTGAAATAPEPSWHTALSYAITYFKAVWQALVAGIVIGAMVQTLIPQDWLIRHLGTRGYRSVVLAGLCSLPTMMCTCCAAPIVVSLRRQRASVAAAAAFWIGNTVLNPAVLVFMTFVLSWKYTVLRAAFGLLLVFVVTPLVARWAMRGAPTAQEAPIGDHVAAASPMRPSRFLRNWLLQALRLAITLIPVYVVTVLVLGAVRAWLFPVLPAGLANSLWAVILFAIAGTVFVIPTAAEIPVIQTLTAFGLGAGPAAALLLTLPSLSLPSALMVGRSLGWRMVAGLLGAVAVLGVMAGCVGWAWLG
ncbi:MAG: permease [Thermoflavifilum sp.]|nr:permease [Thermoflavifilum sp.]MCL6515170.1 permease [Alicyclobacillus sp.]